MPLVNENIRLLRRRLGLTQEKFAEKLSVKRSLIGAYEEGRAVPPTDNLTKIADVFNVTLDQLLNYSFEKEFRNNQASTENVNSIISNEFTKSEINNSDFQDTISLPKPNSFAQIDLFSGVNNVTESLIQEGKSSTERRFYDTQKIVYISRNAFNEYVSNINNASFFVNFPVFELPFLPKGSLRAFDAPHEFPLSDCILIVERVANYDLLKEGENHLLISKKMGLIYRRVYNQVRIKGVLLTNSDKLGVQSCELSISDILEIWIVKSYISKTLPKPQVSLANVQQKLEELNTEINAIVNNNNTSIL